MKTKRKGYNYISVKKSQNITPIYKTSSNESITAYPLNINLKEVVNNFIINGYNNTDELHHYYDNVSSISPINHYYMNFIYLPEKSKKCITSNITILVKSAISNFKNRKILRNAFKSKISQIADFSFQWYFFVGRGNSTLLDKNEEDVIQVDFIDAYYNNTLKIMSEFYWIRDHLCFGNINKHLRKFLFIDDDVFINFANIRLMLTKKFNIPESIIGFMRLKDKPERRKGKWKMKNNQFRGNYYPPFPNGFAVIYDELSALKLSLAFTFVKYFQLDDVYIGLTAEKLGLKLITTPKNIKNYCRVIHKDVEKVHLNHLNLFLIDIPKNLPYLKELYTSNKRIKSILFESKFCLNE